MIADLTASVEAAQRNDHAAVAKIKAFLDQNPAIWMHYGDLSKTAERRWIDLLAGDDDCVRESLVRRVAELRQEIAEEGTGTPLERLLTERIVASWLMTRYFDLAIAQAAEGTRASHTRLLQQQLDKCQRRHCAGIKSLAEVRKLLN